MASTLADLTVLAQFEGTRVPAAPLNGPCLALFGQLLTHPSRVTFPWHPLRHALFTFFGSEPQHLDQTKIGSGWNGLSLILTAFKRLEVVESQEETNEVLAWLQAIKMATIRRSLEFEITNVSTLQDILNKLAEPLSAEDINAARTQARQSAKNSSSTPATSGSKSAGQINGKRGTEANGKNTDSKKRKNAASNGSASMSMSNLSSFPDIDGADDPLQFSSSGSEDEIDLGINGKISGAGNPNRPKVQQLAARLSEVTDIPLHKCIETIARFPDEDLNAINPNAPIPAQFLPPGTTGAQPRASYRAPAPPMMPYAAPRPRPQAPPPQPPVFHQPVQPPLHQQHLLREQSVQAASPLESKLETGPESEVVKKATRSQRPHDPNRPNFSYSALIGQAILSTPEKRLRLAEIYDYVMKNYPYYQKNESGWQNSIRHNLSLQPVFKKMPDNTSANKKGCFWTIVESEEWRFANGGWQKVDKSGNSPSALSSTPMTKSRSKSKSNHSKAGSARSSSVAQDDDDDDDSKMNQMEDVEGDPNAMTFSDDE